ncbi:hypothetical protein [Bacillus toyonensis]|uniref:hypothetical protein n=1 Tax=Bacillus toyonensis TaxID=155322 RepID=UPI0020D27897|nr:hypothetical protein [Bacillus toyonensis]
MGLEKLYDRQTRMKVVLLYTPSSSLSIYVQDVIKNRYQIKKDSIKTITSKKELGATKDVYNVVPFLSQAWLFHVTNGDKVIKKDFLKLSRGNTSGVYLIEFENYKNYKFAKDLLQREVGVVDLYMAWLRRADFNTLYNQLVVGFNGTQLPKSLLDFVSKGYSSEIEAVFQLFLELRDGREIKSRKQIIDICGLNSNTVDNFMFSLLKDPPTKDAGVKKYMSNRLKEAVDLAEKYTWSTFRNYLKRSVKSCIDVKMILSSGEVYKDIRVYENEGYNMKQLKRLQRYIPTLKEISIARLLGLLDNLEKRTWYNDVDFLNFFFNYMTYKYDSNEEVRRLILEARTVKANKEKEKLESSPKKAVKQTKVKPLPTPRRELVTSGGSVVSDREDDVGIMQTHSPDKETTIDTEEDTRVNVRNFFSKRMSG